MMRNTVLTAVVVVASLGMFKNANAIDQRLLHKASFEQNWNRYPAPDEILRAFSYKFPLVHRQSVPDSCRILNIDNRGMLGDNEPATGVPSVSHPNSPFVNWYATCLAAYIKAEPDDAFKSYYLVYNGDGSSEYKNRTITSANFENMFSKDVMQECRTSGELAKNFDVNPSLSAFTCRWKSLSFSGKIQYVQRLIRAAIGPEDVVKDLGIADSEATLVKRLLDEVERFETSRDHRYDFFGTAPTELSVLYVTMMLKFLINIEDTLRY